MIRQMQMAKLAAELVWQRLREAGRLPSWGELLDTLQARFPAGWGHPSMQPPELLPGQPIPTGAVRECYRQMVWDTEVLDDAVRHFTGSAGRALTALYYRAVRLAQDIRDIQRKVQALSARPDQAAWVVYDTINDPGMIDWSSTTAAVDLRHGYAINPTYVVWSEEIGEQRRHRSGNGAVMVRWSEPVTLNGIDIELQLPAQVEVWGGLVSENHWGRLATANIVGGTLVPFPTTTLDVLEIRPVGDSSETVLAISRLVGVQLRYHPVAWYSWKPVELETALAPERAGLVQVTLETEPQHRSDWAHPQILLWYTDDGQEPGEVVDGDRVLLKTVHREFELVEPMASPPDGRYTWYVVEGLNPPEAVYRAHLYGGLNLYQCRILRGDRMVGGSVVGSAPGDRVLQSASWRCVAPPELVVPVVERDGVFYPMPSSSVDPRGPLFRVSVDGQGYTAVLGGNTLVGDPSSGSGLYALPAGTDFGFSVWVRGSASGLYLDLVALASGTYNLPASVWWNGERVREVVAVRDIWKDSLSLGGGNDWNRLDVVVHASESDAPPMACSLFGWSLRGDVELRMLPGPMRRISYHELVTGTGIRPSESWAAMVIPQGGSNVAAVVLPTPSAGAVAVADIGLRLSAPRYTLRVLEAPGAPKRVAVRVRLEASPDEAVQLHSVRLEVR
jgi:hypothetical protein